MRAKQKGEDGGESSVGRVLTTAQVAQLLQLSPRTVQRAIRQGQLKATRFGRVYRVTDQDLREWWEKMRTVSPSTDEG
jgi:excisionase family DNA binding protein